MIFFTKVTSNENSCLAFSNFIQNLFSKMKFRTEIEIKSADVKLGPNEAVLLIGSCFSENIGQKLSKNKIPTKINPVGTLFSPAAISACLNDILEIRKFSETDFFEENETWHSFRLHSVHSNVNLAVAVKNANEAVESAHHFLKKSRLLIITFGSAFSYTDRASNQKVANCHKLPSSSFSKELLQPEEIISSFSETIEKLKRFNPELQILFTVSPVKHIKDGIIENNLSKSICVYAAQSICKKNPTCEYFPSYELLNDDLRDYRFYKPDMAHPTEQAVDYIFDKFIHAHCKTEVIEMMGKVQEVQKMMEHRPVVRNKAYLDFLMAGKYKTEAFKKQFPFLNFESELNYFESALRAETK